MKAITLCLLTLITINYDEESTRQEAVQVKVLKRNEDMLFGQIQAIPNVNTTREYVGTYEWWAEDHCWDVPADVNWK